MRIKDRRRKRENLPPLCPGLAIGAYVHVALEGAGACRGLFVGMEVGHYLLVKLPLIPDIGNKLYVKNHIVIRYVHGGNVYGFRSTLVGLIREPARLAVLAYPESVESLNLRKEERFACLLPGVLRAVDAGEEAVGWEGRLTDLSGGGCSFEILLPAGSVLPELKIGTLMRLQFRLQDDSQAIDAHAELRTVHKDQNQARLGLKFRGDPDPERQRSNESAIRFFLAGLNKKLSFDSRPSAP